MTTAGRIESLWRYPVKSMRGEQLDQAFVGFAGIYGDRFYAFHSSGAPKVFPYLTGREKAQMLLYRPFYRQADVMVTPLNLEEVEASAPEVTPLYPQIDQMAVDVETPSGEVVAIDSPELINMLREGLNERHELKLMRSHRPMTDCKPVSLFSLQTAQQLSQELGTAMDKRRFRANIYLDLASGKGFGEDELVGRTIRIGAKATIAVQSRDPRCKMITLDHETGEANPEVMRHVARAHDGKLGVYAAVLVEGVIRPGDDVAILA